MILQQVSNGVRVTTDSRDVTEGSIFFALKGAKSDGHDHLHEVKQRGARLAVISNPAKQEGLNIPCICVPDVLQALQNAAHAWMQQIKPKVVAITGSLGKTTTKEFTHQIIQRFYRTAASIGNQNSQVGLPLTVLNELKPETEILILEMGMSQKGEIAQLVQIAPPDIAIITAIDLVHAVYFDSIEGIAEAKSEIFSSPHTTHKLIPQELVSRFPFLQKFNVEVFTYTQHQHLLHRFPYPGIHHQQNFIAAALLAHQCGVAWDDIASVAEFVTLPKHRFQQIEKGGVLFIDDSYNAAESSLIAALSSLPHPKPKGKKIAVIGEMLELGKFSEEAHQRVGTHALHCVERLFCLGEHTQPAVEVWRQAKKPVDYFTSRVDLVGALKQEIKHGDVVLLKGSNSNQLWKVLEEIEK